MILQPFSLLEQGIGIYSNSSIMLYHNGPAFGIKEWCILQYPITQSGKGEKKRKRKTVRFHTGIYYEIK
jgi:hypothetical protein